MTKHRKKINKPIEADVSAYTSADLHSALAKWQLDADHIASIIADIPDTEVNAAMKQLFVQHASMRALLNEVINIDVADSALFSRGIAAVTGF